MERVQVGYAKAHFSALLDRVEQGEERVIARRGKAVAKWVPVIAHTRSALQAFEQAWMLGGLDLPDTQDEGLLLSLDDVVLD